jgi:anthranilate/para-aminobenzoate synthase component I
MNTIHDQVLDGLHTLSRFDDPRPHVVRLIEHFKEAMPSERIFAYYSGNREAIIALGSRDNLELRVEAGANPWGEIKAFINRYNATRAVVGYVGYSSHRHINPNLRSDSEPDVSLTIPRALITVKAPSARGSKVFVNYNGYSWDIAVGLPAYSDQPLRDIVFKPAEPVSGEFRRNFLASADFVLEKIRGGIINSATIATQVGINLERPLHNNFAAPITDASAYRTFYLHNPQSDFEFCGSCPETLACSRPDGRISTFKLSGTAKRPQEGPELRSLEKMQQDPKLDIEHKASVDAFEKALKSLGEVERTERKALGLTTLWHYVTELITRPFPGKDAADVLKSVLPGGVSPWPGGLEVVAHGDSTARGPYYGLAVVIQPGGSVDAVQILRTLFRKGKQVLIRVGANISAGSETIWEKEQEAKEVEAKIGNALIASPLHGVAEAEIGDALVTSLDPDNLRGCVTLVSDARA